MDAFLFQGRVLLVMLCANGNSKDIGDSLGYSTSVIKVSMDEC